VDANYDLTLGGGKGVVHLKVKTEFGTPRFYGYMAREGAGPDGGDMVETYVTNEQDQWLARPETIGATNTATGKWRVQIGSADNPVIPNGVVTSWFYPDQFRALFVPFHLRMSTMAGTEMKFKQATHVKDKIYVVAFDFTASGQSPVVTLEYTVDIADGFKILSLVGYGEDHGKRIDGIKDEANDFKKVSDVWVPMTFEEKLFDMGSNSWQAWNIKVHDITVNQAFGSSDFIFSVPAGSQLFGP
jgi:hypothetical protein